jgi:hypothetical protein
MDSKKSTLMYLSYAFVFLCWLTAPRYGNLDEPTWTLPQGNLQFDGQRALATTREFVTRFPKRVLGSVESRQSTGYLKQVFTDLGYEISYTQFDARINGHGQVGRNVLAYKAGSRKDIIAVVAHYDTAPTTLQGATANGSGVGAMIELARVFARSETKHSFLFIATDGAEWGQLGGRDIVEYYPQRASLACVLSLNHVAPGDLASIRLDATGQTTGFAPPALRQIGRMSAELEDVPVTGPSGVAEHLERALLISWADQGPFLHAGIPAINLGSRSTDPARERAVYHSPGDTIENLRVSSMSRYGRVAERIVRSLDGLNTIPRGPMGGFQIRTTLFVTPMIMAFLHHVSFLPLLVILLFHVLDHRRNISFGKMYREILAVLCTAIPFLLLFYPIGILRVLRKLPQYTGYPGTVKDPVLENPSWGIIVTILLVGAATGTGLYFLFRLLRKKLPRPDFYVSKIVLLACFLAVVFGGLHHNPYWAMSFLILPAWFCGAVEYSDWKGGRTLNCAIILAGGIVSYLVLLQFAEHMQLGGRFLWYVLLALSTGLFTPAGYMLAMTSVAIGIRFLAIQFQAGSR